MRASADDADALRTKRPCSGSLAAGDVVRICFTRMCKCDVAFAVVVEQPPPPVRPIMHTPAHTVALALAVIMYHKLDSHLAAGCQREVDARARQPRALMLSVFRACVCVCVFRKIEYNAMACHSAADASDSHGSERPIEAS